MASKRMQVAEIIVVFSVPAVVIAGGASFVGENPLARQGVIWVANVVMIAAVWIGLRLRGQGWDHFGLRLHGINRGDLIRTLWQSMVVLVVAVAAFVIGAIVMGAIAGAPQTADFESYNYMSGNMALLLVSLLGVYVVSSFGEEAVYRGFLINRVAELGGNSRTAWCIALALSTVIFGLIHYDWGVVGMVQTGSMGLALGASYLFLRRNLLVVILAHGYMDTILIAQMY